MIDPTAQFDYEERLEAMKKYYCIVKDNDGHGYVIPIARLKDFYKAVETEDIPNWAVSIGGSISLVIFSDYKIK